MGFADGGSAAFEARQEASRRKAAEASAAQQILRIPPRPAGPPPLSAFDQQIANARREAQETQEREAQSLAWKAGQEEEARGKMATLSREFSQRAVALGFPADHTFIAARQQKRGSYYAYTFIEVVAEGWFVSDHYGHEQDYDRSSTSFYVTRNGPWLPTSWGTQTLSGYGEGLPPMVADQKLVVYNADPGSIQYVTSADLRGKDVEKLLAAELIRLERQSKGTQKFN